MLYIRQQEADIMRRLFQRHLIRRNAKGLFLLNGEGRAQNWLSLQGLQDWTFATYTDICWEQRIRKQR